MIMIITHIYFIFILRKLRKNKNHWIIKILTFWKNIIFVEEISNGNTYISTKIANCRFVREIEISVWLGYHQMCWLQQHHRNFYTICFCHPWLYIFYLCFQNATRLFLCHIWTYNRKTVGTNLETQIIHHGVHCFHAVTLHYFSQLWNAQICYKNSFRWIF